MLIVEDSPGDAEAQVRALRQGGCELTYERVDTPEAMQAALESGHWDLVIADYSMPHFNGLAALKMLRDRGLDAPFNLVSGAAGEEVAVEAMKCGADDYVLKRTGCGCRSPSSASCATLKCESSATARRPAIQSGRLLAGGSV